MYLIRGVSDTGKSLLGQHFLETGLANGETVVCIDGEESKTDTVVNAAQLNVDIAEAEFLDNAVDHTDQPTPEVGLTAKPSDGECSGESVVLTLPRAADPASTQNVANKATRAPVPATVLESCCGVGGKFV